MYDISIDDRLKLVSVKLGGLMSLDEVNHYIADLGTAFVRHKLQAGYLMMIDTSQATLQSQDVIGAFQKQIAHFPKARRIAMINGNSLARMQIRRVMTQDYTRIFDNVEEGRRWLLSSVGSAAA